MSSVAFNSDAYADVSSVAPVQSIWQPSGSATVMGFPRRPRSKWQSTVSKND